MLMQSPRHSQAQTYPHPRWYLMPLNLDHEDLYLAHGHDPFGLSNEILTFPVYTPACHFSALGLHYLRLCYRVYIQTSPSLFLETFRDMCSCYLACHGSYPPPSLAPCRHIRNQRFLR